MARRLDFCSYLQMNDRLAGINSGISESNQEGNRPYSPDGRDVTDCTIVPSYNENRASTTRDKTNKLAHNNTEEPTAQNGHKLQMKRATEASYAHLPGAGIDGTSADRRKTSGREFRNLTVSSVHREYIGSTQSKHSSVPGLRLNGHWLGRIGFPTGQKVQLKIRYGRIVITRVRIVARNR
jgi:hypothetical protein